jgi:CheY-like chemotaxis protein
MPRLRLLIVDDSAQMRRLMRSLFADIAHEIHECSSGNAAVERYFEVHPDWMLMDLQMEDGDGLVATRAICARDPAARIVIVTQFDQQELRRAAVEAGAAAYMLKENLLSIRRFLLDGDSGRAG